MTLDICIAGRPISPDHPPYVIAEISANHNGDLDRALRMIEIAKSCGADAVKIQTYRPDTITLDSDDEAFRIKGGLWDGKRLYDLYAEAHTPWDWHAAMFEKAREVGITLFSSPFDSSAVDLLEELDVPAYKVASFEIVDLPLIRRIASTGKPMIISTGMADADEIAEAVAAAQSSGCHEMVLLHCVSGYPAPAADYNLATVPDMIERFGTMAGLSDHTLDNTTAIAAVALGAVMVEKHFTLDRDGGGPDDSFSLEPDDLRNLCVGLRTAWEARGRIDYGCKSSEAGNVQFRRSLYFVEDLEAGAIIPPSAVRSVRPGYGLPPKNIDDVIGARLRVPVRANTPVRAESLE